MRIAASPPLLSSSNVRTLPIRFSSFRRSSPSVPLTCASFSATPPSCSVWLKSVSSTDKDIKVFGSRTKASSMAEAVTGKGKAKVQVFDSEEELKASVAKYTADLSEKVCKERASFSVVVSGGSLINCLSKLLEPPYINSVDWSKWHIFWVDERVVPKDHPDSNYLLAYNGFLSKVPIPAGNVYAINDALSAEGAAEDYETCLKHLVKLKIVSTSEASGFPQFDLMLLGMGPDGHLASLFPGHPLLQEKEKWVTFIKDSPKPPPERITFTLPVINSSANVALVVPGASKADAVGTALGSSQNPISLPVQMVSPEKELVWFLDKEAASKL
ncbi:PREDICTED: probable 6-phosphogluconolactonase 4, chloroplastic [Ipomoea nil]|uniref:probable 6-phosphogluconolactonase 4, chloroplastic n=1 Tax=Ipomoea nil TaxID=35883 RepID=UPI000901D600|nr:PREDICTED: probable 6-phosphogluconolactonase 4, chloroplastic [Ipomoea nil]